LRVLISLFLFGACLFAGAQAVRGQGLDNSGAAIVDMINAPTHWFQVRVQRRVIVRIPNPRRPRATSFSRGASLFRKTQPTVSFKEKKIGKCLWVNKLASARPGAGKKQNLELVTKSGGVIRAYLGDGCRAREFYAGAYMEKAEDGRLCVDRDLIHARSGSKCEIDKFRLLVAVK